jgi:hypothetical protein
MTLEQRLDRLERENRWMRRIGAVGVAVAAAVFLIGQGNGPPDLVVRSLKVVDKDGKVCIELVTTAAGSPILRLKDNSGKTRVAMVVPRDGLSYTGLYLRDKDGKLRVVLDGDLDGSLMLFKDGKLRVKIGGGVPFLKLQDENGKLRALLRMGALSLWANYREHGIELRTNSAGSTLHLHTDTWPRVKLSTAADGSPSLSLSDKDGRTRALLATFPDGSPGLSLYDKDSKLRALLALLRDGSPRLRLFDAKGKVIWKAPKD